VVPPTAYLAGCTAIAVHLRHRVSRDLDFFLTEDFDVDELLDAVGSVGSFVATDIEDGTLNGLLESTKVQFLSATAQVAVEPLSTFAGLRIAGLGDLLAMKLKVIGDRGELRDYFDIVVIDERTPYTVEDGFDLFLRRFKPRVPMESFDVIIRGLGYFGDVADDSALPLSRKRIERFWAKRQAQLVANFRPPTA
jgi:hypothetical protein